MMYQPQSDNFAEVTLGHGNMTCLCNNDLHSALGLLSELYTLLTVIHSLFLLFCFYFLSFAARCGPMKVSHISDDFLPLLPCVESHSWCLSRPQTLLSPAQPNLSAHSSLRVCGIWVRCTGEPTTTPRWLPPCVGWAVLLLACCICHWQRSPEPLSACVLSSCLLRRDITHPVILLAPNTSV